MSGIELLDGTLGAQEPLGGAADDFIERCRLRSAVVGVIGMGYVGLPLAEAFIKVGMSTIGFDIDERKIAQLRSGKTYIRHIDDARVAAMNSTAKFSATTDFRALSDADAILLCVPTPLNAHREPDLTYVKRTADAVAPHLRPGQLVVLESTTYPGTSDEILIPALEAGSTLKAGVDFAVAYSPEREDPGNPNFSTTSIPKVVGANSTDECRMAVALYDSFTKTVPVSDLKTAEAVKLSENIFRLVNIALANEMKLIFKEMGIDPWEVVEAANTKPFGYMAFYPGPGIGGHCIPVDPFYLTWKARAFGIATRFIDLAGDVTASLPRTIVQSIAEALSSRCRIALHGAKILIVGVAYKKNLDDIRESPAIPIIELLTQRGAEVSYYDPHIPEASIGHGRNAVGRLQSIEYTSESIANFDCAVICTDHDDVIYDILLENAPLVIDTRNSTAPFSAVYGHKIVKA